MEEVQFQRAGFKFITKREKCRRVKRRELILQMDMEYSIFLQLTNVHKITIFIEYCRFICGSARWKERILCQTNWSQYFPFCNDQICILKIKRYPRPIYAAYLQVAQSEVHPGVFMLSWMVRLLVFASIPAHPVDFSILFIFRYKPVYCWRQV